MPSGDRVPVPAVGAGVAEGARGQMDGLMDGLMEWRPAMKRTAVVTGVGVLAALAGWSGAGVATAGAAGPPATCSGDTCTVSYGFTGAAQTFVVPAGVTSVVATVKGAEGGTDPEGGGTGGGETVATLPVSAGTTLTVVVGQKGLGVGGADTGPVYGGGAPGGIGTVTAETGATGGGGSFVFGPGNELLLAAGGAGGFDGSGTWGGGGGGGAGAPPQKGAPNSPNCGGGGPGGSASGGSGGTGATAAEDGNPGSGPVTLTGTTGGGGGVGPQLGGGGGGGGYFGGGGGSAANPSSCVYQGTAGSGGGGSGYAYPGATAVSGAVAVTQGNGSVSFAYTIGQTVPTTTPTTTPASTPTTVAPAATSATPAVSNPPVLLTTGPHTPPAGHTSWLDWGLALIAAGAALLLVTVRRLRSGRAD